MLVGYMRVSTDSDRLTADYVWAAEQSLSENIDGLRSLRAFAAPPSKPPNVRALSPYAYQKASSLVLAPLPNGSHRSVRWAVQR